MGGQKGLLCSTGQLHQEHPYLCAPQAGVDTGLWLHSISIHIHLEINAAVNEGCFTGGELRRAWPPSLGSVGTARWDWQSCNAPCSSLVRTSWSCQLPVLCLASSQSHWSMGLGQLCVGHIPLPCRALWWSRCGFRRRRASLWSPAVVLAHAESGDIKSWS